MNTSVEAGDKAPLLRWLHLTDLHIGRTDESQLNAISSLLTAIVGAAEGRPFDAVFLTGDLAFSGKQAEYETLQTQLITPLKAHSLCKDARFFAAPGNHDMDCSVGYPPVWKSLGKVRQDNFFHVNDSGKNTRAARSGAFSEYRNFLNGAGIESVDPLELPAKLLEIKGKERPIFIVSVVTAFFSDKEFPDNQRIAPAPVHPIRYLLDGLPENALSLVLGHHPVDWFTQESEDPFHSLLVERKALYLHGHEHKVRSKIGARGLVSLGFGAAYTSPLDGGAPSLERNSFAICEVTESLHVRVVSWDPRNGKWRSDVTLPGDFIDKSDRLTDGFRLNLPTTKILDRPTLSAALRSETSIERCIWLAEDKVKRWANLLLSVGIVRGVEETFMLPSQTLAAGHCQFRVKDDSGNYLIYAISAEGDILTYDHIQSINTELDKQDYDGCMVVTLGSIATDAKTLAAQLGRRKSIKIYERVDIVRLAIRNLKPGLEHALAMSDPNDVIAVLIITQDDFSILFQDRTARAWFWIADSNGSILSEAEPLVVSVRREIAELQATRYKPPGGSVEWPRLVSPIEEFNRVEYLLRTSEYFDNVKYAPLAALGFRFRKASLSEIYVGASADVGGSSKASQDLTRAVSEFVESLDLPQAQRDQLESQLRSRYGVNKSAEVSAARKLYQRYNNIVVLGDPGSGKTCFVQFEILAYCNPPLNEAHWYSHHLPVYVSLAEAARLFDSTDTGLLDICAVVASRRGVELPKDVIERALSEGQAAFFFDGLDEVGYLDKRIDLLSEINALVDRYSGRGNRFVLASRPAAVQPVDIPEGMTYIQLKGLSEDEIRVLASRVLTARLGEHEEKSLEADERDLIDRLIEDVESSPGIARLARNPLLLTLLVLIYANTGALSARRHVIYTQAIKTLVSVRGRVTRAQQISESDLRSRLGAIALAIFQRNIAELPKRSEVLEMLAPLMQPMNVSGVTIAPEKVADDFIQEVAEATGLLTIYSRDDKRAEDLITFMHYSFLEYYAAAGLLTRDFKSLVPEFCGNARWKDVTTLLFGILSEQGEVTPLLGAILSDTSTTESISKYKTLLALDCASECDVPPEASQDLIAAAIFETISQGAGRYSVELRVQFARRLEYFLQGASQRIAESLARGLRASDPLVAAAFADLVARVSDSVKMPSSIVDAFEHCLDHQHAVTRSAALFAIESRPELRDDRARTVVQKSLKGSVIEKHAALKAIAVIPAFQEIAWEELRDLLDDANALISGAAAQCLLAHSLKGNRWTKDHSLLDKVLAKLNQNTEDTGLSISSVTLDPETTRELLGSADDNARELAIRSLSLLKGHDAFVYEMLLQGMRADSKHVAASLDAFRASAGAIDQLTIADTDSICAFIKEGERNVRLAAIRLLGEMPDDEQVVRSLRENLANLVNKKGREEEVAETAKALSKHVRRNQHLRDEVLGDVLRLLPGNPRAGFGDRGKQQHIAALLLVSEVIGGVADSQAQQKIYALAEDYRTPLAIRKGATRVFGRIAEPSEKNMNLILKLLERDDLRINDSVYAAAASFIGQSRKKVEYVRRVYSVLHKLKDRLCEIWVREVDRRPESIDPPGLRYIRDAVVEIDGLMLAYEEFSGRAMLKP